MPWWYLEITKSIPASYEHFVCRFSWDGFNLNVKYEFHLRTYYWNSSTSLSVHDGQSCFINHWAIQFRDFQLCWFVWLCDVSFWQQVFPYWAGPMFWWMAKNLMTNNTYGARNAGLLNFAVQIKLPRRSMGEINWGIGHFERTLKEAYQASIYICNVGSLKSQIKTCSLLEDIITSRNAVSNDFESDIAVASW